MAVAALCIAYLAPLTDPRERWGPAVLGLAYPYLLLVNVVFIGWWILQKSRMMIFSIVAILAGFQSLYSLFRFCPGKSDNKGIVICSYNVKDFEGIGENTDKRWNRIAIQDYLRKQNPDIVCLQEIDSGSIAGFNPFPYHATIPATDDSYSTKIDKNSNLIIFSRFPIAGEGKITFQDTPNMIVFADLVINKDTFRLYNCHMQSYQLKFSGVVTTDPGRFRSFWWRVKTSIKERARQIDLFEKQIRHSPFPVIIAGDFNDPPVSRSYKKMKNSLKMTDAFSESGQGFCHTYKEALFSFRVDYIFHDELFNGYNFKVDRVNYSDHYPVVCKLIKTDHLVAADDGE